MRKNALTQCTIVMSGMGHTGFHLVLVNASLADRAALASILHPQPSTQADHLSMNAPNEKMRTPSSIPSCEFWLSRNSPLL